MRAFVALLPPEDVVEDLEEFLRPRREVRGPRWVTAEQLHLTLTFLPDLAEVDLDELAERLTEAGARRTPIPLRLAGAGAFPDVARAKVLWVGVRPGEGAPMDGGQPERAPSDPLAELGRLATNARHAAVASGTRVDGAAFRAHLTVARFGRPEDATRWLRVFDAYVGPAWTAEEFALVRSDLGQGPNGRPRYTVLDRFHLGPPGEDRWWRR